MAATQKSIAYGTLEENGDTWFLMRADRMMLLDIPFRVDDAVQHKTVSVIGTMGIPPSSCRTRPSRSMPMRSINQATAMLTATGTAQSGIF